MFTLKFCWLVWIPVVQLLQLAFLCCEKNLGNIFSEVFLQSKDSYIVIYYYISSFCYLLWNLSIEADTSAHICLCVQMVVNW